MDAALSQAQELLDQGEHAQALLQLEPLLAHTQEAQARAPLLMLLTRANQREGRATEAVRHASEAVRLLERLGEREPLCDAHTQLALAYAHLGLGREALEAALSALSLARALGDAAREGWALARVGNAYGAMDNPAQARETTQQAREIAQTLGLAELDFACLNNQAYYTLDECEQAAVEGQAEDLIVSQAMAQLLAEQALATAQTQGNVFKQATALSNLIEALLVGQDWARAQPLIEHLDSQAQEHHFLNLQRFTLFYRARLAQGLGQTQEAIGILQALLQPSAEPIRPRLRRLGLRLLYELQKQSGQPAAALGSLEQWVQHERQTARQVQRVQTQILLIQREIDQAVARAEHAHADAQRERERSQALEQEQRALRQQLARTDRAAREDVLTRLSNRRHAEQALDVLWERAQIGQLPLAIALLDLDHFKRVNDERGHAVGDAVLRELSELLRLRLRSADLLARWGGEEFLVALLGPQATAAQAVFERLRNAVEHHPWGVRFPGLQQTLSAGVALRGLGQSAPCQNVRALVQCADAALYQAKDAGRNRVCVA